MAMAAETVMVADDNAHSSAVTEWFSAIAVDLSLAELVDLFERGFTAMWTRAHATLGDVTLTAIVDRVLYDAAERHPELALLDVEPTELRFDRLREGVGGLETASIRAAIQAVLVEFLRVLGSLTAEILTPALLAALTAVAPAPAAGARTEPRT